jgi:hypothetical protein
VGRKAAEFHRSLAPKWWMYPVQLAVVFFFRIIKIPMDLLGVYMVALGMWTNWRWRITWPWNSQDNPGTDAYYDKSWSKQQHWSWKLGDGFAEYWWRAIRNPSSNFARYAVKPSKHYDIWITAGSHRGFTKGPTRWAFPGIKNPPKTLFVYKYDTKRWWLGLFIFTWFISDKRYFQWYSGWKFDRADGFGWTLRCWVYRNEDS